MTAILFRKPQNKGLFRDTLEPGGQKRKSQEIAHLSDPSTWKARAFTRDRVLNRLRRLPPNVIITDFDQTITSVKSNRTYYEEFKKIRAGNPPSLLRKDILKLVVLRVWSRKFPSQTNKQAFYRFFLPGLSIDKMAERHEINPNFMKAVQIIEQYGSDCSFGICSVGIGQIVEKSIAKLGVRAYGLMLNIYEEKEGILTGRLYNDYLFTEKDKRDLPQDRIILGDDRDQIHLSGWPNFININAPEFEKKMRTVLNRCRKTSRYPALH